MYLVYRSEDGNLYYLPVVKKTEKMVLDKTENHDYLSTFGHAIFSKEITKLLLGDIDKQWAEGTVIICLLCCKNDIIIIELNITNTLSSHHGWASVEVKNLIYITVNRC